MTAYPRNEHDVVSPWIVKLLTNFLKKGHDVSVFTSSYKGLETQVMNGVLVYRFRYAPKGIEDLTHDMAVPERLKQGIKYKLLVLPYILSGLINALIFKPKHDIIHVHWPVPHIVFGLPMKRRWKVPMLLYIHGGELNFLKKLPAPLKKTFIYMMNKADLITVNSSYTKRVAEDIGLEVPIEIVPFGNPHADATMYPFKKKNKKTILFVGRLIEVKGIDVLLRAFKIIKKMHPDVELRIVGDGPLKEEIVTLSDELGIPVTLTGYKTGEELKREYLNASVFVLPSKRDKIGQTETLGVVTIEALSYGLPVVASNLGGIPDVIKDKKTGLLFNPGDHEELAEKIMLLLENPEMAGELVRKGQEHVKNNYSWKRIVDRMEQLYIGLLGRYKT